MKQTFMQGMVTGIQMQADYCATHDCDTECEVKRLAGEESCADYILKHANAAASIFYSAANKGHSYYEEFKLRFPESEESLEDVSSTCCCATMFGRVCPYEDSADDVTDEQCQKCWQEKYAEAEDDTSDEVNF